MPLPSAPELYLLVDRSPVGMYRSNREGRFTYVNASLARMLGYTVDELLQKNLNREVYADPSDRERIIETFLPKGVVDGAEVEFRKKDGSTITIQLWGHALELGDGTLSFDASILDISQVRRQRLELESTAKILDLVVMQMPALYWVVDRELRIIRTGGAVQEVLGYPGDRFMNVRLASVHRFEPGSVDPVPYHERALDGAVLNYDTTYRGKQLAVTVAPYRQDGAIVGAIGTTLDVTASRALERRLVDAQRAESDVRDVVDDHRRVAQVLVVDEHLHRQREHADHSRVRQEAAAVQNAEGCLRHCTEGSSPRGSSVSWWMTASGSGSVPGRRP